MATRTQEELLAALGDQLAMLQASCDGYDKGNEWEALRLATTLHTIVNDGRAKTKSILTQLGVRDQIPFVSYVRELPPGNMIPESCLTFMHFDGTGGAKYVPLLDDGPPRILRDVPFADWWTETIFIHPQLGRLSRLDLTYILRSQDGGGHFDEEVTNKAYLAFKAAGIGVPLAGEFRQGAPAASVRHIAFELQKSLERAGF